MNITIEERLKKIFKIIHTNKQENKTVAGIM